MTIYYVDFGHGSASDSNAGTSTSAPWKTMDRVETAFNDNELSPGDRIRLVRGNTWTHGSASRMIYLSSSTISSGTRANPIIIEPYGTGTNPILDMNNQTDKGCIRRANIAPSNGGHYITIRGIEIINVDGESAINGQQSEGWIVEECYLHGGTTDGGGVHFDEGSFGFIIRYNLFVGLQGEAIYIGSAGGTDDARHGLVYCNTALDCEGEAVDCKCETRNVVFAFNDFQRCGSYGGGVGTDQMAVDGTGHIIAGNYIGPDATDTDGGIAVGRRTDGTTGTNCLIIDNLVVDNDGVDGGIRVDGIDNVAINNTIINCARGIVLDLQTGHTVHRIRNNVFNGCTNSFYRITGDISEFDVDYSSYDSGASGVWFWSGSDRDLSYVQGTLGVEANAITSAQNFAETTRYTPSPTSGFLGNGQATYRPLDYRGKYSSGSPDRGWRQMQEASLAYFRDSFQSGDFTRWTSSSGSGIAVSTSAAHSGTNSVSVAMGSSVAYRERSSLGGLHRVFASVYINADSLSTSDTAERVQLFLLYNSSDAEVARLEIKWSGSLWQVRCRIRDDATNVTSSSYYDLTSGWNRLDLEVSVTYGTFADGYCSLSVNGVFQETISDIDNDTLAIDKLRIGLLSGVSAISGTAYIDDVALEIIPGYVYEPVEIDTNVKTLWEFAGSANILLDTTSNDNDLTANGTPVYTGRSPLHRVARGVEFDSGDYYSLSSAFHPLSRPVTWLIAFLFETTEGSTHGLYGFGNDSASQLAFQFYKTSAEELRFRISTNGTSYGTSINFETILLFDVFYTAAIVWNSDGSFDLYLNGRADDTLITTTLTSSINNPTGNQVMNIGRRTASGTVYNEAFIAEAAILNRALSENEVKTWHWYGFTQAEEAPVAPSGPIELLKFNNLGSLFKGAIV